jgi:hypothetical protein
LGTEQTECSETSAYKIQTPGNHPKESIKYSEQGESLKSRMPIISNKSKLPSLYLFIFTVLQSRFHESKEHEKKFALTLSVM